METPFVPVESIFIQMYNQFYENISCYLLHVNKQRKFV